MILLSFLHLFSLLLHSHLLSMFSSIIIIYPSLPGAPVIVSFPHFYLADKKYVNAVEGIKPVHEHHQTFLDLNPVSKFPLWIN